MNIADTMLFLLQALQQWFGQAAAAAQAAGGASAPLASLPLLTVPQLQALASTPAAQQALLAGLAAAGPQQLPISSQQLPLSSQQQIQLQQQAAGVPRPAAAVDQYPPGTAPARPPVSN